MIDPTIDLTEPVQRGELNHYVERVSEILDINNAQLNELSKAVQLLGVQQLALAQFIGFDKPAQEKH